MGMFSDVLDSVFQRGVNQGVVRFTNLSILALILSLIFLGFVWEWNVHVFVLLSAAVGLFLSLQWFLSEMKKNPKFSPVETPRAVVKGKRDSKSGGQEAKIHQRETREMPKERRPREAKEKPQQGDKGGQSEAQQQQQQRGKDKAGSAATHQAVPSVASSSKGGKHQQQMGKDKGSKGGQAKAAQPQQQQQGKAKGKSSKKN